MGARKRNSADARKEAMKSTYFAKLNNCPTSPRKMRLVADMIRGKKVNAALFMLKYSNKEAALRMEKLLVSALSNWKLKNESARMEDEDLFIKEVHVDSGRQLKRLRTAPQGRGHRIRKRSNHITLIVDHKNSNIVEVAETTETEK